MARFDVLQQIELAVMKTIQERKHQAESRLSKVTPATMQFSVTPWAQRKITESLKYAKTGQAGCVQTATKWHTTTVQLAETHHGAKCISFQHQWLKFNNGSYNFHLRNLYLMLLKCFAVYVF